MGPTLPFLYVCWNHVRGADGGPCVRDVSYMWDGETVLKNCRAGTQPRGTVGGRLNVVCGSFLL